MSTLKNKKTHLRQRPLSISALILIFSLAQGCGQENSDHFPEATTSSNSVPIIIGDLDWQDIDADFPNQEMRKNANAVGDVKLPAIKSRCTGFLINQDTVMTNHHCVPSSSMAVGITVAFRHEINTGNLREEVVLCDKLLGNNRQLDYALLKCEGQPGSEYGIVTLAQQEMHEGEKLYIIQQNCDYYLQRDCDWTKKISFGEIVKVFDEYAHNADTLGGSSGSPVFTQKEHIVSALHHAGRGNNGLGRGIENYAVPMHKIVEDIKQRWPDLSLQLNPNLNQDQYEPNNILSTATQIKFPLSVSSERLFPKGDRDIYEIKTRENEELNIHLEFDHKKGDLDLYLLDQKRQVVERSAGVKDSERIQFDAQSKSYYIVVYGHAQATGSYTLSIQ